MATLNNDCLIVHVRCLDVTVSVALHYSLGVGMYGLLPLATFFARWVEIDSFFVLLE